MIKDGIDVVVKSVLAAHRGFSDKRIKIHPNYWLRWSWWKWLPLIRVPLRYQDSDDRFMFYLGQMLATFTRKHNLTFDTVLFNADLDLEASCRQWTVEFGVGLVTEGFPTWQSLLATYWKFAELKTLLCSELSLPSPWGLSSLGLPWNGSVVYLLFSTAGLLSLLLFHFRRPEVMKRAPSLWALRILGSLFLVGYDQPKRLKALFLLWALPCFYIMIIYATVLQSAVVAPENMAAELSFDEMVERNYSFYAPNFAFIRTAGEHSKRILGVANNTATAVVRVPKADVLRREVVLSGRTQDGAQQYAFGQSLGKSLLELNMKNRRVVVAPTGTRHSYRLIIKSLGRNSNEGREDFFSNQEYVMVYLPKPYMFLKTLEILKASGFLYHFYQMAEIEYDIYHLRLATSELRGTSDDASQSFENHGSIDFSDSIISETFLLFIFSITICLFCLSLERALRQFGHCKGAAANAVKGLREKFCRRRPVKPAIQIANSQT